MELVTGKAGTPHVSSADDGRRIAGEVGTGSYVLQTGGRLAPSLVDANTVRFATGDMVVQGRHIGLTAPEDVKVASGTQGKKRMDYICVHYKRDVAGSNPTLVETCEWKVLRGTPGTKATAPTVPAGSILDGDAEATVPVASVDFDGLTTGKPKLLIPVLTPLATLGDSVSQAPRIFTGTIARHLIASDGGFNVFTHDEYVSLVGRPFDQNRDYVAAMNADGGALNAGVYCVTYYPSGGNLFAGIKSDFDVDIRINYLVVCGGA